MITYVDIAYLLPRTLNAYTYINHSTGKYILDGEEICKIMVGAWENNDSTYTLQSIYDRAPVGE